MKNNSLFSFLWKETKQYRLRIIAFEIFALICFGLIPMFIQPAIFGSFLNSMANKTLTINSAIFLSLLYTLFFISTELFRFLFVEKQLWYGGVLRAKNKIIKTSFNYAINHSKTYFSNFGYGYLHLNDAYFLTLYPRAVLHSKFFRQSAPQHRNLMSRVQQQQQPHISDCQQAQTQQKAHDYANSTATLNRW